MNDCNGGSLIVTACNQLIYHLLQHVYTEENAHGRLMSSQRTEALTGRNRCTTFVTGDDYCLRYAGKRILLLQGSCSCQERADTGNNFILDIVSFQLIHLLLNSAVNSRVTSVKTDNTLTFRNSLYDNINDLRKGHGCRIINGAAILCKFEQGRVNQRACVDDNIRTLQKVLTFNSNELRIAGTCTNNRYEHDFSS